MVSPLKQVITDPGFATEILRFDSLRQPNYEFIQI